MPVLKALLNNTALVTRRYKLMLLLPKGLSTVKKKKKHRCKMLSEQWDLQSMFFRIFLFLREKENT